MGELNDVDVKTTAPILTIEELRGIVGMCEREISFSTYLKLVVPGMNTIPHVSATASLAEKVQQIIFKRQEIEQGKKANEAEK